MSLFELPIFYTSIAAGLLIAILTGFLSVMVVVRRMAFFSDAIAHASLTGIALGLLLQLEPLWSAIGFSILVGLGIAYLSKRNTLSLDTIIGVFYSAAVALGVILIGFIKGIKVDLIGFLFGDILGISQTELIIASVLTIVVIVVFLLLLNSLTQLALSKDLARVHGVKVDLTEFIFMVLLAATIAVGIKLVGIILIGPLLIMPAAIAKNMSNSLLGMLIVSITASIAGVILGFFGSFYLNTPTGPTIVLTIAIFFGFSLLINSLRKT